MVVLNVLLLRLPEAGEVPILFSALSLILLVVQVPAALLLLSRLAKGPTRKPPVQPGVSLPEMLGTVSIIVPTLNEAKRIGPCLEGLTHQGYEVREVLVVDSRSQDGTPEMVKQMAQSDPRFRLLVDDPLPPGWVGRPWALHTGFLQSAEASEWVLGIDADTQPSPGLVAGLLAITQQDGYDLVSLSPRFILKDPGELWLQPSLLMTLLYRFGPAGDPTSQPERVMANGQCFLCRRSLLAQLGGYTSARSSFCDDVTLARYAASQGAKVGFLDGSQVLKVRMYEGAIETWQEWGRSLDLKDAASSGQIWGDLWLLLSVQGLPLPVLLVGLLMFMGVPTNPVLWATYGLNLFLVAIRVALLVAIVGSYDFTQTRSTWAFWLSPLSDPLAFLRILLSSLQTEITWRGRSYTQPGN
ncbi:MAG: glycosyltransferase family 2 protein [Leptolyngbyaceae cyanobacterium bins.59]|nr:glycosyltransferase family 2 protein [Leptolyngbyaceae cyanobacterium bins.59]